jgi:hypothetical protein
LIDAPGHKARKSTAFRGAKDGVDLRGRGAAALKASLLESLKPVFAKSEIRAIN